MFKVIAVGAMCVVLAGCSGGIRGIFSNNSEPPPTAPGGSDFDYTTQYDSALRASKASEGDTIWDLFTQRDDPNVTLEVNKYLWNASLDVLNFLPIQAADPFTGTISTGYGRPPGGGAAYRATIFITDPALDARSLRVSLQGNGGRAVSKETSRAVEDAILTRARQMRVADGRL